MRLVPYTKTWKAVTHPQGPVLLNTAVEDEPQWFRMSIEVPGDVHMNCRRAEGDPFMVMAGAGFDMRFATLPSGVSVEGTIREPAVTDAAPRSGEHLWRRFMGPAELGSHLAFSYHQLYNLGAHRSNAHRPRQGLGFAYTKFLKLNVTGCELAYFQTFLWDLLEYTYTGLLCRLAFIGVRPPFEGAVGVRTPYDEYDPQVPPTKPYTDLMSLAMECNGCSLQLPHSRSTPRGDVFSARLSSLSIGNRLVEDEEGDAPRAVRQCTSVCFDELDIEAPLSMRGQIPGAVSMQPVNLRLDTWQTLANPRHQHADVMKLVFPEEARLQLSEELYCALLRWMTESLMEPWVPRYPPFPPAPAACEPVVPEPERRKHFAYEFEFDSVTIAWFSRDTTNEAARQHLVPPPGADGLLYTMTCDDVAMEVSWFNNEDFETSLSMRRSKIVQGKLPVMEMRPAPDFALAGSDPKAFEFSLVWLTLPDGRKRQTFASNIGLFDVCLTHAAPAMAVVDTLLSHTAARAGGMRLMGWVEPEGGWPEPGAEWPGLEPPTQLIRYQCSFARVSVLIAGFTTSVTGLSAAYNWDPKGPWGLSARIAEAETSPPALVTTAEGGPDDVVDICASGGGECGSEIAATVRDLRFVVNLGPVCALAAWSEEEMNKLMHLWAPTPAHRQAALDAAQVQVAQQPAEPAQSDAPPACLRVNITGMSLLFPYGAVGNKGALLLLGSARLTRDVDGRRLRHALTVDALKARTFDPADLGDARTLMWPLCITVRYDQGALPGSSLPDWELDVSCTPHYDGRSPRVFEFTYDDVGGIISAMVYHGDMAGMLCSARPAPGAVPEPPASDAAAPDSVLTASPALPRCDSSSRVGSSSFRVDTEDADLGGSGHARNSGSHLHSRSGRRPRAQSQKQPLAQRARRQTTLRAATHLEGLVKVSVPAVLITLTNPDESAQPEPGVFSSAAVELHSTTARYTQWSSGKTELDASFEHLSVRYVELGHDVSDALLALDEMTVRYTQAEGDHGDQELGIRLRSISVALYPEAYFGLARVLYDPYMLTRGVRGEQRDLIISDDFELQSDLVLGGHRRLKVVGTEKNYIKVEGGLNELHLIGDGNLIEIDEGVTLEIIHTKLYTYGKLLEEYVKAADGAYIIETRTSRPEKESPFTRFPSTFGEEARAVQPATDKLKCTFQTKLQLTVPPPRGSAGTRRTVEVTCTLEAEYKAKLSGDQFESDEGSIAVQDLGVHCEVNSSLGSASPRRGEASPLRRGPADSPRAQTAERTCILQPVGLRTAFRGEKRANSLGEHYGYVAEVDMPHEFHWRISTRDTELACKLIRRTLRGMFGQGDLMANLSNPDSEADLKRRAVEQRTAGSGQALDVCVRMTLGDVLIVEDSRGFDVPLFFASMSNVRIKANRPFCERQRLNWSAKWTYDCDTFNMDNCEWEPTFDKKVDIEFVMKWSDADTSKFSMHMSKATLMLTPQFIKTARDAQNLLSAFQASEEEEGAVAFNADEFKMYEVVNQTGYDVQFIPVMYDGETHGEQLTVKNLKSHHFSFPRREGKEMSHTVRLMIDAMNWSGIVDVGHVGTMSYTGEEDAEYTSREAIFVAVELNNRGRKRATLRCGVSIVNQTPVSIRLVNVRGLEGEHAMIEGGGGSVSVPREAMEAKLRLQPEAKEPGCFYDEAQLGIMFGDLRNLGQELFLLRCEARCPDRPAEERPADFICYVEVLTEQVSDTTITLFPTLRLVNLTGVRVSYSVYDAVSKKGPLKPPACTGTLLIDKEVDIVDVDPRNPAWLDVELALHGDHTKMRRDAKRHPEPFKIHGEKRASFVELTHQNGRKLFLRVEYGLRTVTLYCRYWIINNTDLSLQLALQNPMKGIKELSAGQFDDKERQEGVVRGGPFLLSPTTADIKHMYCRVCKGGQPLSLWSGKFDVETVGETCSLEMDGCHRQDGALPYTIRYSVSYDWGRGAGRTVAIRFMPRWVFINRARRPLLVRHEVPGAPGSVRQSSRSIIDVGVRQPEYYGGAKLNRMAVKYEESQEVVRPLFCRPLALGEDGQTDVVCGYFRQLREEDGDHDEYDFDVIRIATFREKNITFVTFNLARPSIWVENRTELFVSARQHVARARSAGQQQQQAPDDEDRGAPALKADDGKGKEAVHILRYTPRSSRPFPLERPDRPSLMELTIRTKGEADEDLRRTRGGGRADDEPGTRFILDLDPAKHSDQKRDMKEALRICPLKIEHHGSSVYVRVRHRFGITKVSLTSDSLIDQCFVEPKGHSTEVFKFERLAVVLLHTEGNPVPIQRTRRRNRAAAMQQRTELAHLTLKQVKLTRSRKCDGRHNPEQTYQLQIQHMQLDDQRQGAKYEVVLASRRVKNDPDDGEMPAFLINGVRIVDRSSPAIRLSSVQVRLNEMQLRVNDEFLHELFRFSDAAGEQGGEAPVPTSLDPVESPADSSHYLEDSGRNKQMSIKNLDITSFDLSVSLNRSGTGDRNFFRVRLGVGAFLFSNFEDRQLHWRSVSDKDVYKTAWVFMSSMVEQYLMQTRGNVVSILTPRVPGSKAAATLVDDLETAQRAAQRGGNRRVMTQTVRLRAPTGTARDRRATTATSLMWGASSNPGSAPSSPRLGVSSRSASPRLSPAEQTPPSLGLGLRMLSDAPSAIDALPPSSSSAPRPPALTDSPVSRRNTVAVHQHYIPDSLSVISPERWKVMREMKKKRKLNFGPGCQWNEHAQLLTWDEFRSKVTDPTLFKRLAHLPLAQYMRTATATSRDTRRGIYHAACRCELLQRLRGAPGGLRPPNDSSMQEHRITWKEFACHTTWEEFRRKTSDDDFRTFVEHARDAAVDYSQGFEKLPQEAAAKILQQDD
eukprot:TRINITY_DN2002_c3_g1_i1.p1 TRINITY_DN2002_c3_g1~~TRINITY_DN2002_c3_g1_i1.p1  ORF type:complete len:2848 (+),score=859.77 TRINITY_DN2002_c3_g1_i1:1-8544(+)